MAKFIIGCILSFISAVFFTFGTCLMYAVINAKDAPEAIAGIVIIPIAICSYVAQFAFGSAGQALLWTNFAKRGRARIASMIVAIIAAVVMVCTVAVLVYAWSR